MRLELFHLWFFEIVLAEIEVVFQHEKEPAEIPEKGPEQVVKMG